MRAMIRRAVATLPKRPTRDARMGVVPTDIYTVSMEKDTARNIAGGIRELAKRVREVQPEAYVRLLLPHGAATRRYGPVRLVSMFVMCPTDGGAPGMRHRLDVGVV